MKQQYHYFYKITNKINNHFYYGVHNTSKLEDGYMGSGVRLQRAYKKYGIENFEKEILKFFDTADEAFEYEAEIVNETLVYDENCYNLSFGGHGGFIPNIQDYIKCSSLKNKVCVRLKNTEEYFLIDKDKYDSTIYDSTWTNKHRSEESKNQIREKMTPKNSKNTHIWVNKDGVVKYLDKRKLNDYINNGWQLGRTGYKPIKNGQGKKNKYASLIDWVCKTHLR